MLTKIFLGIAFTFSLFGGQIASAQTVNSYPVSWQRTGSADTDYSWGFGTAGDTFLRHVATTSLAGITVVAPDLCYTTSNAGNIYLEVWLGGTTTGTMVGSSSVPVSNLPLCTGAGTFYNGSTTVFTLNASFNAILGQEVLMRFRTNQAGPSVYITGDLTASPSHFLFLAGGIPFIHTGKYTDSFVKLGSGLLPYSTAWADLIAGAKANECDGIIECAVAWAFWPDPLSIVQFQSINFASSSPFGYIYDMDTAYQSFMTGLNATSTNFKITLDMTTLGNTATVFGGVSTSSVTVFDVCWVNKPMGELPANSFRDTFLPIVVFMMWIGLGWLFYSTAHKIW